VEWTQRLYTSMLQLDAARTAISLTDNSSVERPFRVPLSTLQLDSRIEAISGTSRGLTISELFTIGSLVAGPPAYHSLAQLQWVILGAKTIRDKSILSPQKTPLHISCFSSSNAVTDA
jgi:hypothetical protein